MYLRRLSIRDFRSWTELDVGFAPGPSVLVGANGQGKTNVAEAVMYLATLASHRVPTDAPLVRTGADRAAVAASVVAGGRELRVEVEIWPRRANRARLNGVSLPRTRDIVGGLRAVLFAPEDLGIVRGDPGERRRFLDDLLTARTPRLAGVRSDYERVLKQRAALLKSAGTVRRSGPANPAGSGALATLEIWDRHLATSGAALLAARLRLLDALRPHIVAAYSDVAPMAPGLSLHYISSVVPPDEESSNVDEAVLEAALHEELGERRRDELERGVNLVGPHRDDLELRLGALPLRGYASHGESWSAALALRLGGYELLRADAGEETAPVLVLDDVFAELDSARRDQLAVVASKAEQTIVTAAVLSDVPESLHGVRYNVADGQVRCVS
jgi:DNA replication and repair protein RecF